MKNLIIIALCSIFSLNSFARGYGDLAGVVVDDEGLPMNSAVVEIISDVYEDATMADSKGRYDFSKIPAGIYTLTITFTGYDTIVKEVEVRDGGYLFDEFAMTQGVSIKVINVPADKLFDPDIPEDFTIIKAEELKQLPTDDPIKAATFKRSDMYVQDDRRGAPVSIKGSRSNSTKFIVDGVEIDGGMITVPYSAIKQVKVITGGLPAKYGDTVSGVIEITTKSYTGWYN